MDRDRFDSITRRFANVASRRQVLGGLGVAAVGALVGREATAAPSPVAQCMKDCNAEAQGARKGCKGPHGKGNNSKSKNACLKTVQEELTACRSLCSAGGGV
jgi:hypothetical protein